MSVARGGYENQVLHVQTERLCLQSDWKKSGWDPILGHDTSACACRSKGWDCSGSCETMDGWSEAEYVTAPATEQSASPPSMYLSASAESIRMVETVESAEGMSSVEQEIERSKSHWSELSDYSVSTNEDSEAIAIENREVFKTLQSHPQWGGFFLTFGYDTDSWHRAGELVVGEKFAEGGQAEIFHAHITWRYLEDRENYEGYEWVLKVFKKGTLLRHLQSQWPQGYFQYQVESHKCYQLGMRKMERYHCAVCYGTLLEDGRFAFLMQKEMEDLRHLIDRKMLTIGKEQGPFSKGEAEAIMYGIACGMDWLHKRNIVHRDLKASNVLFTNCEERIRSCSVADFECSIGVVGTGFWRAPEILQACKERSISQKPELFTKSADVYSYGMTCYEILTGKVPFGDHPRNDYDLVLNGHLPELPEYVDNWVHELLDRCWHPNPTARPSFGDILNIIETNSIEVLIEVGKLRKSRKKLKAIFI